MHRIIRLNECNLASDPLTAAVWEPHSALEGCNPARLSVLPENTLGFTASVSTSLPQIKGIKVVKALMRSLKTLQLADISLIKNRVDNS